MEIKELKIEGFKSIGSITLKNPNPFSVFVGANASGKSNIFEALELFEMCDYMSPFSALKFFGDSSEIGNQINKAENILFEVDLGNNLNPSFGFNLEKDLSGKFEYQVHHYGWVKEQNNIPFNFSIQPSFIHFTNFSRLFIGNKKLVKTEWHDDSRLNIDAGNLEKVLKRILTDEKKKEEIVEILQLLIPGFKDIEVSTNNKSRSNDLLIYENIMKRSLPRHLISDGTYNIIAIVTALYQSDEPQFLCIEEPENGLNPFVVRELVEMIRLICKEKGHYIWLNTHSQSLISVLTTEEIIIVDKKNGLTQVKQIQDMNLRGLKMDEALFTNYIGGGMPW